ncbi:MAG: hypothetical protein RL071_3336 [Pseudomonadota bacterium]|jgi:rhodanese-related sulfurtransferase
MRHAHLRTLALLTLLPAAAACHPDGEPPARTADESATLRRDVDTAGLKDEQASGKVSLLLDVRSPGEYAQGHVPGAQNIPVDVLVDEVQHRGLPKTQELHLICESGARSSQGADALAAAGYRVVNVKGGTAAWRRAGLAVE